MSWRTPADREILKRGYIDPERLSQSERKGTSFTANRVRLEVCGPDVVNLSFVDLPGIIANAGPDDPDAPELIKKIVRDVIEKPTCLILSCLSLNGQCA